jgi:hypothetical protein
MMTDAGYETAAIPDKWNTYAICTERCGWVTQYAVWGKPLSPRCCPTCGAYIGVVIGRWWRIWIPQVWWKRWRSKGHYFHVRFEVRPITATGLRNEN